MSVEERFVVFWQIAGHGLESMSFASQKGAENKVKTLGKIGYKWAAHGVPYVQRQLVDSFL